jgi:hypothetical protein
MAHWPNFGTIRMLRATSAFALISTVAGASISAMPATVSQNAPSADTPSLNNLASNVTAPTPAPAAQAATAKQRSASKPLWHDLTAAQQQALAPLAAEWDNLGAARKMKWLAIGNKYASMKPGEQQRVQERMREWIKLTPEQRRIARESYARAKKLNADQKSKHWEQYQQLPEEQKKKLAADAAAKKRVATLPPASQSKNKTVQPIKSASKPVLEQSVTPQVATQSGLQPSPQPTTK